MRGCSQVPVIPASMGGCGMDNRGSGSGDPARVGPECSWSLQPQFTFSEARIRSGEAEEGCVLPAANAPSRRPSLPESKLGARAGSRRQRLQSRAWSAVPLPLRRGKPWQRRGRGRGAREGAARRETRSPLSPRVRGATLSPSDPSNHLPACKSHSPSPPPHPVPVVGHRLLLTLLLGRPRARAPTRLCTG